MAGDSGIPGHFPHQLAEWWERGAGAAKIRWGQGGDFDRCVRLAVEEAHMDPERAKGFCAERHHAATGMWPATHAAMVKKETGRSTVTVTTVSQRADNKPYGNVTYADPKNGKYPIDTEERARAAWDYINKAKNAGEYPMNGVTLSEVKGRIRAACKRFGIEISDDSSASRADATYFRTYELEDIHIVRSGQGDSTGRLVEAYAAVFNQPAEIHDFEGHYTEEIDPAAFNKVLADIGRSRAGLGKVKVMYNHGMTIHGTPSERGSMPIGTPVDIRPEARGLLTVTRYSETSFADEVLENIRNGSITAQSFTGRIVRSDPQLRRGDKHRPRSGQLTTVRRTELGLKEYGPTPFEAYSGAEIVGVRMSAPGTWQAAGDDEHEEALPPDEGAAAGEPPALQGDEHSARYHQHALYRMISEEKRKAAGLDW